MPSRVHQRRLRIFKLCQSEGEKMPFPCTSCLNSGKGDSCRVLDDQESCGSCILSGHPHRCNVFLSEHACAVPSFVLFSCSRADAFQGNRIQSKKKEIREKLSDLIPQNSRESEELARRHRDLAASLAKEQRLSELYRSLDRREKDMAKQEADVLRKLAELEDPITGSDSSSAVAAGPSNSNIPWASNGEMDRAIADFNFNDPLLFTEGA